MMATMAETRETSLFEDAIDVPLWLVDDRTTAFADRVHRDRELGVAISARGPLDRVRAWWQRVDAGDRGEVGLRLARARSLATLAVALIAIVLGASLALAVLHYDGRYPVNVVTALALLVGLPFLLFLTTLPLLPGRLPGLSGLQRALASANAGNLATAIFNRISGQDASRLHVGWSRGRGSAARFSKWQLILWSQWAALCFSTSALVTCFAQVVFTDLAFGWSTTLNVSATEATHITAIISWPWASFLPDAVPSATLVDESRYFRLTDTQFRSIPAARLTGWWPFLLMALIVYGILPRLVLWVLAKARLTSAARGLLLDHPEVRALLDRMNSTVVELDNNGPPESPVASGTKRRPPPGLRFADAAIAISWNDALTDEDQWAQANLPGGRYLDAGGARRITDDETILETLDAGKASSILVFTKAWEPPLLDFQDFLEKLRARLGSQISIVVVPLGINGTAADTNDLAAWDHGVGRLGDAQVYVYELPS
jgi:hypothetical protein